MPSLFIDPSWLPSLKKASRGIKVSDRQLSDGLWAVASRTHLGDVEMRGWVSGTRWRVLGAPRSTVECLTGTLEVLVARIDHRKPVDEETGKSMPSDLDGLKGVLADGQSVEVEVSHPLGMTAPFIAQAYLTRGASVATVDVPGARDKSWKDADGKPTDYALPNGRVLASEFVAPFKGRTLVRVNSTNAWAFVDDDGFGLIAEREYPPAKEEPPVVARSAWGGANG